MKIDRQKRILSNYDAVAAGTGGMPCVCVHGKRGTGKTALLDELKNTLLARGANVYFAVENVRRRKQLIPREPGSQEGDFAIRELLRQLARLYGEKNDPDFIKFVLSYTKGTLAYDYGEKAKIPYSKDSLVKFIYDCLKTEPTVFIVDDLDKADAFTINLLGNLLKINALTFLIFSHSDKLVNKTLTDMLSRNTELVKFVELRDNDDIFSYDSSALVDKQKTGGVEDNADEPANDETGPRETVLDEAVLVLSKPGNERQLLRHYIKNAQRLMGKLAYEKAAATCRTALNAFHALNDKKHDDDAMEIDILTILGDAQADGKDFKAAADSYLRALQATETHAGMPQAAVPEDYMEKRAEICIKLAECSGRMNIPEREREFVMLAESFFCVQEHRTRYYDLYKKHILKYLSLLARLDERAIFREKLKQAYSVCLLDDKEFTCSLYCEEAFMCMENGKYEKSEELLFDAQSLAKECACADLWDAATNSLAICSEQMGKPFLSAALWKDLIKSSHNPVKVAEAKINVAMLSYEQDGNAQRAAAGIKSGIDLYTLAGENRMAADITVNLKGTPLADFMKTSPTPEATN